MTNLFFNFEGSVLDATGNPTILFWIFGAVQSTSGLLVLFIPFVQRIIQNNNSKDTGAKELELLPDVVVNVDYRDTEEDVQTT